MPNWLFCDVYAPTIDTIPLSEKYRLTRSTPAARSLSVNLAKFSQCELVNA